jgi:hypothetical protein
METWALETNKAHMAFNTSLLLSFLFIWVTPNRRDTQHTIYFYLNPNVFTHAPYENSLEKQIFLLKVQT